MPTHRSTPRRARAALLATALLAVSRPMPSRADAVVRNCANSAVLSAAVAAGGLITFECSGSTGESLIRVASTLVVDRATTIDGGDTVSLDGGGDTRLFDVTSAGSLDLRHIVLQNAKADGDGGAVHNAGFLALDGAKIRNSAATINGGAISTTGPVDVTDSEIEGCTATNGGGIWAGGAAARVTIANGALLANHASVADAAIGSGGAVSVVDGASVSIFSSVLAGNDANAAGGALAVGAFGASASLEDSTVAQNSAGIGGGLFGMSGALAVRDSTVWNNVAIATGGGIESVGGSVSLTNVTLSDNRALRGGGLYNEDSTATLTNVTVAGNSATDVGGGLVNSSAGSSLLSLKNVLLGGSKAGGNCFFVAKPRAVDHSMSSDASCVFGVGRDDVKIKLGPLETNGGGTLTRRLLPGSPAIDAGSPDGCPATDQRFLARPQGASCDIGAVEFAPCDGAPPPPTLISARPRFGLEAPIQPTVQTLDFRFDWVGPDCASRFELVLRRDARSGPVVFAGAPTRASEQIAPRLAVDHEYFWSVRACNAAGCTESRRKRLAPQRFL